MGCYTEILEVKVYFGMGIQKQLRTYVIQNPVSGLSDAPTIREKISQVMSEYQIPFEIYERPEKMIFTK